jgi:citrate lyase beta subunit
MTTQLTLDDNSLPDVARTLRDANGAFMRRYPGESGARQPVHTVYGGGHLFRADTAAKLGALALRALDQYAADPLTFAAAVTSPATGSFPPALARTVDARVREKLEREPVEDYRIDFEDGYGARPDAEEDAHVVAAASEIARGMKAGTLPPFIGIRVKTLSEEWRRRSVRTLDLFVTTLVRESGALPSGFVVTLPKVTLPAQVTYFVRVLAELERRLSLGDGALRFEIMVETPQIIVGADGRCALPALIDAGAGRISAAHFGTYDYTAACNITAAHQRMQHPACQFALRVMQVSLAGTGVWLSDGSTTVMPVPIHHRAPDGPPLSAAQDDENRLSVHNAWRLHYEDVRHSLANGFYQGWDLHPAQLPTRYAALFSFFLEGLDAAADRLRNFVQRAAQATLVGDVFDDAATGQGLLNYFLRAVNCGAISADDVSARTGITREQLQSRSFAKILRG